MTSLQPQIMASALAIASAAESHSITISDQPGTIRHFCVYIYIYTYIYMTMIIHAYKAPHFSLICRDYANGHNSFGHFRQGA